MAGGDDRSSDAYHKKWEKVVKEEEAAVAAEDDALAAQSDAALGLSAAAHEPRSTAEAEERARRDALRAAKQVWRDKDHAMTAAKLVVEKESGVTRTLTQADLGDDKHAVHIKGAKGCAYTLDARMRVAKVFVEDCEGCVVRVECLIVSQHVEMWACDGVQLVLNAPVATVQVDGSARAEVVYARGDALGAVLHATCASLAISFAGDGEGKDLVAAEKEADERGGGGGGRGSSDGNSEIPQYITRRVNGEVLTERVVGISSNTSYFCANPHLPPNYDLRPHFGVKKKVCVVCHLFIKAVWTVRVIEPNTITSFCALCTVGRGACPPTLEVRGKDEYPTTVREMQLARAEAAANGDAAAAAALAAAAPVDTDTAAARAEGRKEKGNEAFKEGNYPQASVFYTQALELAPQHHIALANRSACFLKMGEHEKALADAEACVAAKSDFVKGHFRRGLSLHAMGRYGEAVGALEKAEKMDPKNKQVVDALRMAAFKARRQAEEGGA